MPKLNGARSRRSRSRKRQFGETKPNFGLEVRKEWEYFLKTEGPRIKEEDPEFYYHLIGKKLPKKYQDPFRGTKPTPAEIIQVKVKTDEESGQTIISGMGELHLDILVDRMRREFSVEANIGKPQVAYREAIRNNCEIEGKFVRQSGGRGQYGHVWLKFEPAEDAGAEGLEFVNEIVGGTVPKDFIPAVSKGIEEQMQNGVLAGYPLLGLKATLYDGSFHDVDSSEMAFKIAASMATKKLSDDGGAVLLEPMMRVEVVTPEENMGDVVGDLNRRRGIIHGMDENPSGKVVNAEVPLAEMFGYATDLRSATQGRATFTMEFDQYAEAPKKVSEAIISRNMG